MILYRQVGQKRLRDQLSRIKQQFPGEVRKALLAEAHIELKEAIERTPKDTGDLRKSGRVGLDNKGFRNYRAFITFGDDGDVHYAVYVHEDLEAFHPIGQAKFLESTLNESAPYMLARVKKRLEKMGIR